MVSSQHINYSVSSRHLILETSSYKAIFCFGKVSKNKKCLILSIDRNSHGNKI